jgi:hypothetical protein
MTNYSVFKNNVLARTFSDKRNADWFAYALRRLGHKVEVQPAPGLILCDLINDLEGINTGAPDFININGARVWA